MYTSRQHSPTYVILQIRSDVPLEYSAMLREMFLAYRLLEDHGQLKARHSLKGVDMVSPSPAVGRCM